MFNNGIPANLVNIVHTFHSGSKRVEIYQNGYQIIDMSRNNPVPPIIRISGGNLFVGIVNNVVVNTHFNPNGALIIADVVLFTTDPINGLQHAEMTGNII
jgi:hypothetical protein